MFQYLLYQLAHGFVAHSPLGLSYRMANLVADLHFLFSVKSRRQVLKNLHWIDGEKPGTYLRDAREVFRNFGKNLVDFFGLSHLNQEKFFGRVKVEGLEYVQEAFDRKKGVIGITAHFGNWEWGGVGLSFLGYPVHALVLNHPNRLVNQFFVNQRVQKGVHIIPTTDSVWEVTQCLTKNEMLLLVADRDFSDNGIPVSFLGRKVYFPRGPAALSRRYGSPLVVGFVIRLQNDFFNLTFMPLVEPIKTKDLSSDLQRTTQEVATLLENIIRRFPTQWFLFQGVRESP